MSEPAGLLRRAREHLRGGSLDEARRLVREVVSDAAAGHDALHLLGVIEQQADRPDRALEPLRDAVSLAPDRPQYRYNLALVLGELGEIDEAEEHLQEAVRLHPSYPRAWAALGRLRRAQQRPDQAIACFERSLSEHPDQPGILDELGLILRQLGRNGEAARVFRRAIYADPSRLHSWEQYRICLVSAQDADQAVEALEELVEPHSDSAAGQIALGRALEQTGRPEGALAAYRRAASVDPASPGHLFAGRVTLGLGLIEEALSYLRLVTEASPDDGDGWYLFGEALTAGSFFTAAEEAYRRSITLRAGFWPAQVGLGWALLHQGLPESAQDMFEAAVRRAGGEPAPHLALVEIDDRRGDVGRARARLQEITVRHPDRADVWRLRARLATSAEEIDQAAKRLAAFLEEWEQHDRERMATEFALARLLDRQGRYDEAFDLARAANSHRRVPYDASANAALVDRLIGTFDAPSQQRLPMAERGGPPIVFVVGVPRSGTTLVEQILASHPGVEAAGEPDSLNPLLVSLGEDRDDGAEYPEVIYNLSPEELDELAAVYRATLRQRGHAGRRHVIDKTPQNAFHLGFISRAMPDARVIEVRRDPRDVAVSLYFRSFAGLHRYAYDLRDIAAHLRDHRRMMEHWQRLPGLDVLTVDYERLVADPEPEIRRMLSFLELPWDRSCLAFHERRRFVTSASYRQVRQPLYTHAVGRWRAYEEQLGPFLAAWCEVTG